MTAKRFSHKKWYDGDDHRFHIDCYGICDSWRKGNTCDETKLSWKELCDLLNSLYENVDTDKQRLLLKIDELEKENKEIKQLIHTMLVQIEADKINTENARYWGGIIFTSKEFRKMQQIWKGDLNDRE